jgi:hypothetical protein
MTSKGFSTRPSGSSGEAKTSHYKMFFRSVNLSGLLVLGMAIVLL